MGVRASRIRKPYPRVAMFRCLLSVAALLTVFSVGLFSYAPIEDKTALPILTPSLALRKTEKIRLDNGLEAYLISDPQADKSAAALVVKVGSWSEPSEEPGLAHFLEHMLFMGTDKYPDEGDFDQYLSDHGGSTDAFTADDMTGYVFEVDTAALEGALDRYARFFKEPRFNASGVARELKAIDQEYAKNIEQDERREYQILKELALEDHPFHRFSMGNSQTLSKVSRDSLIKWYQAHYSADVMRLVLISPLSLEVLRNQVITAFEGIKNLNISSSPFDVLSTNKANLAHIAYIEPVKNRRNLNIIWDLPPVFIDLEAKPESLLCSVLGDEGPRSLLAALKREGLADSLNCGLLPTTQRLQQFYLAIGLTKEGVKQVDAVIERVFQTIAGMKQKGLPAYLYEDTRLLAKLHYQYQPRQDSFNDAMRHAMQVAYEPMQTYPEYSSVIQRFDPQLTKDLLDFLTPYNAYYQLSAPAELTGMKPTRKEPWLGAQYALLPVFEEWLKKWSNAEPHGSIDLPGPNPYLPSKLAIINPQSAPSSPIPHPVTLKADPSGMIYFAADTQFGSPEVAWHFYLKTPQVNPTPQKGALIDLYARYLNEILKEGSYAASVAGLSLELIEGDFGLNVKINGYSEKASLLLEHLLKAIKAETVNVSRFERVKLLLKDDYNDVLKGAPYEQAAEWLRAALFKQYSTAASKAQALEKIDPQLFAVFFKTIFSKVYVEGVLYGNMSEAEAREVVALLYKELNSAPYPKGKEIANASILLPSNEGPFYFEKTIEVQGNAVILAIENGPLEYKSRAAQQILVQAMSAPFFNVLRTQQQTGYIVTNYATDIEREMFGLFLVQSNTHEPRDLISRFELFIESYLQELKDGLPLDRFEKIKQSLINELQRPAKSQAEMAELLFKIAFKYKSDFAWIDKRIEALGHLTYEECVQWAHEQYGPVNKRRLAICTKGRISPTTIDYQRLNSLKQLRKYSTYSTQ